MSYVNRCIWLATSTGTGSFVAASAAQNGYLPSGCLAPTIIDGGTYDYFAVDVATGAHEEGTGIWSVATSTLTRATIRNSSNSGSIVSFVNIPTVYMGGPTSNDMLTLATANQTWYVSAGGSDTANSGTASGTVATNSGTTTSSPTLHFTSVPSYVVAGMVAWNTTTNLYVGIVQSTGASTVTLVANAANAVTSADVIAFAAPFATLAHAVAVSSRYNWNAAYFPTILNANATYTGVQIVLPVLFNCPNGGVITFGSAVTLNDAGTGWTFTTAAFSNWTLAGTLILGGTYGGFNIFPGSILNIPTLTLTFSGTLVNGGFNIQAAGNVFGIGLTINTTTASMGSLVYMRGFAIFDSTTITFTNPISFATNNYVVGGDGSGAFFAFALSSFVNPNNVTAAVPIVLTNGAFFEAGAGTLSGGSTLTRTNFPGLSNGGTILVDPTSVFQPDWQNGVSFYSNSALYSAIGIGNLSTGGHTGVLYEAGSTGIFGVTAGAGGLADVTNGNLIYTWDTSGNFQLTAALKFSASTAYTHTAADASLSRTAAAAFAIGNGTAGDASGTLKLASLLGTSAAGGVGYATGAGGTVTQATSKSTGVTLNHATGQITMNNAALVASTDVNFTLTNSAVAAGDLLVLNHAATGTFGSYVFNAQCASGSATINVRNVSLGSLSEAIVIGFAVIKGATT